MYFNHAFHKLFLGTGPTVNQSDTPSSPNTVNGFITTTGTPTIQLAKLAGTYGPGFFGFFDPNTWTLKNASDVSGEYGNTCCPLVLASASLLANDKIGPFAGGYRESNKSKIIKPKHISRFYRVDACAPQQTVVSIGNTPYTDDSIVSVIISDGGGGYQDGTYDNVSLTGGSGTGAVATVVVVGGQVVSVKITSAGTGYTTGDGLTPEGLPNDGVITPAVITVTAGIGQNCCKEFLCDETYYIRIDVKGSPALRFLNHNAYWNIYYYTGCCNDQTPPIAPNYVDSTLVMIGFAQQIVEKVPLQNFIFPVVYDEASPANAWFPPGTTEDPNGNPVTEAQWWNNYVSTGHTPGACAGLRLFGAYVDTVFQNCTFQPTDFFMKEPLKILASEVDMNGDPCVFSGLCVVTECPGRQGMGFGDTVAKDLILSESYLQNFFHSDLRIREITQGNQILDSVNRKQFYTRYVILHNVPRYNNPSGTYDNDQYALEIITQVLPFPGATIPVAHDALETFMGNWLSNCGDCVELEVFSCGECETVPAQPLIIT